MGNIDGRVHVLREEERHVEGAWSSIALLL